MHDHIAFVHTSPVHVRTFDGLMAELAPELRVRHVVAKELLALAMKVGTNDPGLAEHIQRRMREAAATGARVVVCTCSTIGGVVEQSPTDGRYVAARIDRAMADRAVTAGSRVLVVAALESTLAPTYELLMDSARTLGQELRVDCLLVPDAWAHFVAGETQAYVDCVVAAVAAAVPPPGVVVLAQASMAPATPLLEVIGINAVSSPRLGVQRAIAQFQAQAAR
ncbi:Asp/Glu/hydantoin racemase [Variovorax ginsengisoli]|uniref:ABC-type amino acid transport substrate-binding protein n=1 Tax=Variovorax ginsengisoli TaxID=363844 RepID=A0ABT9S101_9BURK|nr:Asp/Glu/hydantoin racemase [Variovorax ginsengisoli]MDP9898034.1 ABC-type amino acid transport substrate-binding protein [Variovorax ginsengisoli]